MLEWWGEPRRRIKIPKEFKQDLYEQQKGCCMYCGIKLGIAYLRPTIRPHSHAVAAIPAVISSYFAGPATSPSPI